MTKMNPTAITLMIFGFSIGHYVDGMSGAMLGLAITSGISFLVDMLLSK